MLHLILFKSPLPIFSQSHKISLPLSLPLKQRGFSTSFSQSPFFTFTLTAIWAPHAPQRRAAVLCAHKHRVGHALESFASAMRERAPLADHEPHYSPCRRALLCSASAPSGRLPVSSLSTQMVAPMPEELCESWASRRFERIEGDAKFY